jgi:hypothetical protein
MRAGEKNKPEIILPLEDGVDVFMSRLFERARGFASQAVQSVAPVAAPGSLSTAAAGAGSGHASLSLHVHGNLFTNQAGLKDLERTLDRIRISERTRQGASD